MSMRMGDPPTRDLSLLQSAQDEAAGPLDGAETPSTADRAGETNFEGTQEPSAPPLFDSPAHIMWAGVLGTLLIMALIFVLLLRGRASRARADKAAAKTDFFAPADADDFAPSQSRDIEPYDDDAAAEEAIILTAEDTAPAPQKRAGFFGGGDRAKRREEADGISPPPARAGDEASFDGAGVGRRLTELERSIDERMDARLRRLEDRIDAGMRSLAETGAGGAGGDDLFGLLSGVEDALAAQSEGMKAETRNLLADFAGQLDQRLVDLGVGAAGGAMGLAAIDGAGEAAGIADKLDRTMADHEAALAREFDDLRARIARQSTRVVGAGAASAPRVQLIDAIQRALPAGAYQINADLDGRARADALVRLAPQRPPVAIDAQFPLEAFDELDRADSSLGEGGAASPREVERAEQNFRRAALGHVVHVGERLVLPPRTVDSAILFLPSEATYTELQTRFPDIMQDAVRARVWIVSPASFAATLNVVRGLLQSGETGESRDHDAQSAERIAAALDGLRRQVAALETRIAPGAAQAQSGADGRRPGVGSGGHSAGDEGIGAGRSAAPAGRRLGVTERGVVRPAGATANWPEAAPPGAARPPRHGGQPAQSVASAAADARAPETPSDAISETTAAAREPSPRREPRTFTEPYSSSLWSSRDGRRFDESRVNDAESATDDRESVDQTRRDATQSDAQSPDERRFPLR